MSYSGNPTTYQQTVQAIIQDWGQEKILGAYNAAIDKSTTIFPKLKPILKSMLSMNKAERPTAAQLKNLLDANQLF